MSSLLCSFNKNYLFFISDYGLFKLECKTKTESGVEFTTSGSSSSDTGKVGGSLETKYKWSEYGKFIDVVEIKLISPCIFVTYIYDVKVCYYNVLSLIGMGYM